MVIGVADLPRAVETYTSLGFELHTSAESAMAYNADDCLELVAIAAGLDPGRYVGGL